MHTIPEEFQESRYTTEGSVLAGGQPAAYQVISEDNLFCDEKGAPTASIFSYSYIRTGLGEAPNRPVLFVYNGGPGSACIWQHLGFFGPRRVRLPEPIHPPTEPPYELEDNPHSLLDVCDLVLIDPVETGYGRLLDPNTAEQYFGTEGDAAVTALFIERWLTKYDRWGSKIYLAGESYGTIRSCMVANALMGGPFSHSARLLAISVSGIIMLGSAITTGKQIVEEGVEGAVLKLPSVAAANWYHHPEGKPDLETFVEEAYHFSYEKYQRALFLGDRLEENEQAEIAAALSRFTGLSETDLRRQKLVISTGDFAAKLLQDEGYDLGLYDSRYKLEKSNHPGTADPVGDDPAMGQYTPSFTGVMSSEYKRELKIDFARSYKAINFDVNRKWNYSTQDSPMQNLLAAMRRNTGLRVFFATGLFDLVTTLGGVRYVAAHLGMPAGRVIVKEYPSGHMPYLGEESACRLAAELREFLQGKG